MICQMTPLSGSNEESAGVRGWRTRVRRCCSVGSEEEGNKGACDPWIGIVIGV